MIDFHSHILPGLDDGAVTIDESIAMSKALELFGYKTVCCTPHCIKGYYELTPKRVREATLMLQADLDNADILLELWPGMEYMLDECFAEFADDLLPLGDTRLVLCEAPQRAHPEIVQEGLELIIEKGFVPLVAHPERTQYFYDMLTRRKSTGETLDVLCEAREEVKSKSFLKRFFSPLTSKTTPEKSKFSPDFYKEIPEGTEFQANLGSFTGYYGELVQRQAYELLKRGIYTALASDLHDGGSAAKVLQNDKFDSNPLLKKLAGFDGATTNPGETRGGNVGGGQGELFTL